MTSFSYKHDRSCQMCSSDHGKVGIAVSTISNVRLCAAHLLVLEQIIHNASQRRQKPLQPTIAPLEVEVPIPDDVLPAWMLA